MVRRRKEGRLGSKKGKRTGRSVVTVCLEKTLLTLHARERCFVCRLPEGEGVIVSGLRCVRNTELVQVEVLWPESTSGCGALARASLVPGSRLHSRCATVLTRSTKECESGLVYSAAPAEAAMAEASRDVRFILLEPVRVSRTSRVHYVETPSEYMLLPES